ncbi:MAG: exodeoxyribonuclease VII small subunit [Steroidobacteraceae bacterium]
MARKNPISIRDLEAAMGELEAIVEQLEQGELPLEESLKQFERGVELTRACQGVLQQAEQRVLKLSKSTGPDGELEDFDTDEEGGAS